MFPPLAVHLNVAKIQLGGHILLEHHKKALHDSNRMNSSNGIFNAPLSHCVCTEDGVIGKQISIQNVFFRPLLPLSIRMASSVISAV